MNSQRDALALVAFAGKLPVFLKKAGGRMAFFGWGRSFFCEKKGWGNNIAWGFAL